MLNRTLPTDSEARKNVPLYSGCYAYFAAALAGVARWSKVGNDKHNPGQPMHHARGKSNDHADCIVRHLMDIADIEARVKRDCQGSPEQGQEIIDEADALAWRALALSQELHEQYDDAPLAPAAVLPKLAKSKLHQREASGNCECGDSNCTWPNI
jgi:hypothetical protein